MYGSSFVVSSSACVGGVLPSARLVSFVSFGARLVCQAIRPSARLACTCPVPLRWLLPLLNSPYTPLPPSYRGHRPHLLHSQILTVPGQPPARHVGHVIDSGDAVTLSLLARLTCLIGNLPSARLSSPSRLLSLLPPLVFLHHVCPRPSCLCLDLCPRDPSVPRGTRSGRVHRHPRHSRQGAARRDERRRACLRRSASRGCARSRSLPLGPLLG